MSECRITDYKNTASLTSKIIHVGQDELQAAGGARFDTDAFLLEDEDPSAIFVIADSTETSAEVI